MWGKSYTKYHALDFAETHSIEEIKEEIARLKDKAENHNFPWHEVGNVTDTWTRHDTLQEILIEKQKV